MARKVFFHIGLPKTGTTYLQTIMWANREELKRQGVLLPGTSTRDHLLASVVVREDPHVDRRGENARASWSDLVHELSEWPDTAVISHEFFAGASVEQVAKAMADLRGAEVHLVVTARDTLSLVTARWQEFVKHGWSTAIDDYPPTEDSDPQNEWGWGTMDVGDVLSRWTAGLRPEHVHVLSLPKPTEPHQTLWTRFATLVGVDPTTCDSSGSQQNESLGVVEVELLRRINTDIGKFNFRSAVNRGVWIRGYLAQRKLVPRSGERFWPSPERVEMIRGRSERAVAMIREQGYDVIGDLEDLLTPPDLPPRRHPSSVTESEMLAAATATIAWMMTDVRNLTKQARESGQAAAESEEAVQELLRTRPTPRERLGRARNRVRQMWSRS